MTRAAALLAALCAGPATAQDLPAVPSGQPVTFHELIRDAEGVVDTSWRFRFLAPEIAREGGRVDFEVALTDMHAICDAYVAPRLAGLDGAPDQVIISLMDQVVEFGQTAPHATQFFEAFSLRDGTCVWEGF